MATVAEPACQLRGIDYWKHNLDKCRVKYRLPHVDVYESPEQHHFTRILAPVDSGPIDFSALTDDRRTYIDKVVLQSKSEERIQRHIALASQCVSLQGASVLDIGCGGARFLDLCRDRGAEVTGIEPNDWLAAYVHEQGIDVTKRPIEAEEWNGEFDVVSLWDVLEHVNYPQHTISSAAKALKTGGWLLLDTPAKDGGYYRLGDLFYRLTGGAITALLRVQYSNHRFGHKQILSRREVCDMCRQAGLKVESTTLIKELSFPVDHYLARTGARQWAVRMLSPLASLCVRMMPIRNKMIIAAQKP